MNKSFRLIIEKSNCRILEFVVYCTCGHLVLLYVAGNYQQALETYKRIHHKFPENVECMYGSSYKLCVKAHANGRNIFGQQHPKLLGPICYVRAHGTTTMLALVAHSLKLVKLLGPYKRTQHCWPITCNNVVTCCVRLHRPRGYSLYSESTPPPGGMGL